MRTTQSDLDRVQRIAVERGTCSQSEVSLKLAPLVPGRRYGKNFSLSLSLSLSLRCLSIYLSNNNKQWVLLKNKMRYIYKKVFRLSLSLIMFPLVLYYGYTTLQANLGEPPTILPQGHCSFWYLKIRRPVVYTLIFIWIFFFLQIVLN